MRKAARKGGLVLKAMRPKQWFKNVLLLSGLYFPEAESHAPLLLLPGAVARAIAGFFVFCALSGAIYLVNDAIDAPRDRLHPKKKHRPIASGEISPAAGVILAALLGAAGLAGAWTLSPAFLLCSAAYFGMMICYSLWLKEAFFIDVMIISMGFIIRAVSGVIVLREPGRYVLLTPWFVICVLFLSLLLAFCKRRSELLKLEDAAGRHRKVLKEYSPGVLDAGIGLSATATVLAYALYSTGSANPWMMLTTLPFVLFGIFRYLQLVYGGNGGDAPEDALFGDRALLGSVGLWALALLLVFYPSV